jgi:hypothetical protein
MQISRIPDFANKSREGMSMWFAEMSLRGLLFHPEDAPRDIITIATGEPSFTADECIKLERILDEMFALYGDGVCEAAYPIFMKCMGIRLAA